MKIFTHICFIILILIISGYNEHVVGNVWFNYFHYNIPLIVDIFLGSINAIIYSLVIFLFGIMFEEIE